MIKYHELLSEINLSPMGGHILIQIQKFDILFQNILS